MEPKEENVEYHIEIQNCDQAGGVDAGNGEVMYVLDLGGADIPENIAMQLAQLAADGSLDLTEGTNSIMVQNETGASQTHLMQVEQQKDDSFLECPAEGPPPPQVIHLQMGDDSEFLADPATAAMIPPVTEISFQDEFLSDEKSIFGKSKPRSVHAVSLLDRGGKIDRPSTKMGLGKQKVSALSGGDDQVGQLGKGGKPPSAAAPEGREKKVKGDKLPIYPFLKGKTPVMLTVAEDGQVLPEGPGGGQLVVKSEGMSLTVEEKKPPPPIILDFSSAKSKLDNMLRANLESAKSEQNAAEEKTSTKSVSELNTDLNTEGLSLDTNINDGKVTEAAAQSEEEVDSVPMDVVKSEPFELSKVESSPIPNKDPLIDEDMPQTVPEDIKVPETEMDSSDDTSGERRSCEYDGCDFKTSKPLHLAQHLESIHDDKTPFHCFQCEKRFKLKLTLVVHDIIHQKGARPAKKKRGPYGARHKSYQCPLCPAMKKLKQQIFLHAKNEHGLDKSSVFTCEACKFVCYSEEELQAHIESTSHSTDRRSFCEICNQSFTNIYQHKAAVHSDARPFLCNQCGYSAKTKSSLRYHMVIHLDSKDWSCPKCPYKSSSERRLKRHMKIHDPNKKHQCSKCSFATHDAYEFKRHFAKVHGRVKSYNCKFCGQQFVKHHEIRLHLMFEHECNDAFFCNFCDFTCATRADYKEHIQVHYGKNRHVCEICGFTGRYRTHYRRHMLTHTTNKPFTCNICFKSVREASNLRRHMLTHSEDKPLACSVCGYRCKIRSRLMNHMKTHSELRPFACHLCKYTTKFNGNLMKHLENHARYKPHKCQYCSYACNERNKLRRHMNFKHKGLLEPKKEADNEQHGEMAATGGEVAGAAGEGDKELVILPSQEQFLLVPKEELEKMVSSAGENGGAVISTDGSGNIVVSAGSHSHQSFVDGGEDSASGRHSIIISDQDGNVVSGLKEGSRSILTTLDIGEGKNIHSVEDLQEAASS